MNLHEAMAAALNEAIDAIDKDHTVVGFAVQVVSLPPEGGHAQTTGAHVIHPGCLLSERDVLNEAVALLQKAISRWPEEPGN